MRFMNLSERLPGHHNALGALYIVWVSTPTLQLTHGITPVPPGLPTSSPQSPRAMHSPRSFENYRIARKKLSSLIFFFLAVLIAFFNSPLAWKALSPSFSPIPAGKSIDCSSSGTWCTGEMPPVLSARAALEAIRRCFFDFAEHIACQPHINVAKRT